MSKTSKETAAEYTRRVLRQGGRAKKSLGQNFLIDDTIIERIVEEGIPKGKLPLVEIGPGPGGITRKLTERYQPFWAVEFDEEKVEILKKEFAEAPIHILHMDALKLNLTDLWDKEKGWLVGNLPYYITNPLLMHFLDQKEFLLGLTVMVQKEVADRMMAAPGGKDYGILSIATQLSAEAKRLFDVPPTAFFPQPKITSTVIRLEICPYPGFEVDQQVFFRVVKAAFSHRRKTLLNTLSAGLRISKEETAEILSSSDIDPKRRAEEISILEYQKIVRSFQG